MTDPMIRATGTATILSALDALQPASKPVLGMISPASVATRDRDVPLVLRPTYRYFLRILPEDERARTRSIGNLYLQASERQHEPPSRLRLHKAELAD